MCEVPSEARTQGFIASLLAEVQVRFFVSEAEEIYLSYQTACSGSQLVLLAKSDYTFCFDMLNSISNSSVIGSICFFCSHGFWSASSPIILFADFDSTNDRDSSSVLMEISSFFIQAPYFRLFSLKASLEFSGAYAAGAADHIRAVILFIQSRTFDM